MSIYANRVTIEEAENLQSMFAPYSSGFRGNEPKQIISDGQGGTFIGDSFDLSLLKAKYPERFSTPVLSEQMVSAKASNDTSINGMMAVNVAGIDNEQNLMARRKQASSWMMGLYPDANKELVDAMFREIYSSENAGREVKDLYQWGPLGVGPGTIVNEAGKKGEDKNFYEGLGDILRPARLLAEQRDETFLRRERNPQDNSWKPELVKAIGDIEPQLLRGKTLEDLAQDEEAMDSIIQAARETSTINKKDLANFDLDVFQAIKERGLERGLNADALRVYVYEQAQQETLRNLTALVNYPDRVQPLAVLEQIKALAMTVGPDFVDEAMASVSQLGPWDKTAWERLPEDTRNSLEFAGYTKDNFMRDDSGELRPDMRNEYMYSAEAMRVVNELAATNTREMLFEKGWHKGWSEWTRRLTDTFKVDIGNDPFAMYFLVPSVLGGVTASAVFGAGAATASTTSLGRVMAMTAADGLTAGLAEGYAVGVAGQAQAVAGGMQESLDWNGVTDNMLLYGGLGAIGGAGLAGVIGGAGPMLRNMGRLSTHITNLADDIAASGVLGEATMIRGLNRLAEREATVAEVEGAQIFSNIQNRGLAIRLNRGEVEAKDAIAEVVPNLVVVREGGSHSEVVDSLFSSQVLAENGMSPATAVDLVYGIQRRLGPNGRIAAEEFDEVVRAAFIAARDHAERVGSDLYDETGKLLRDVTDARIKLIDEAVSSNMKEVEARFVGGSGIRALTDNQYKDFKTLIQMLKDGALTPKQLQKLMNYTQSLFDERLMRSTQRLINERATVPAEELAVFNRRIDEIVEIGTKARNEDSFLKTVLRVENALNLLRNERTIKAASDLGISAKRLMQYAQRYKSLVGDEVGIKALDAEMPDARAAFTQIAAGEGMEILDATPPAFNVNRFLDESDAVKAIRDMTDLRRKITNMRRKATKLAEKMGDEKVIKRLDKIATRLQKRYQEIQKRLGIELDLEGKEAYNRLLKEIEQSVPFSGRTGVEKTEILSNAIDRLILRSSPDAINVGEAGRTRAWFASMFQDTSLGMKFERLMASISLWPIQQAKLFRHRNRIVRGFSNWITGQHVTNRVFSNSTDFMSIESIVEGAAREAVPYLNISKGLRTKLGSQSYGMFDRYFLKMRKLGRLVGKPSEYNLENVPEDLLKAYERLGGEDALRADLHASQRAYTNVMSMAMEEAAEAGVPLVGHSAHRYTPDHIRGGLTKDRVDQFVRDVVKIRRGQLLSGSTKLDLEMLDGLGFIRLTHGGEKDAMGRQLVNKKFDIPQDSPFHISDNVDINREFAEMIIKRGWSGLVELDPEAEVTTAGRAGAVASDLTLASDIIDDPATRADIMRVMDDVGEIFGNDINLPLGRSVETAGVESGVARGILGLDETVVRLENARSTLARVTEDVANAIEDETGLSIQALKDEIDDALVLRQRALVSAAEERMSDTTPRVRRKPMNANQKIKFVNDREAYDGLSTGHAALNKRLDNLIAEGFLNEDAAKLIRLAFVDMDPHKIAGMSFTRMDVEDVANRWRGIAEEEGIIRLRRLADLAGDGNDAAVKAAITLVHETAHIAFLSSPARMQGVLQSLYNQAKNNKNGIRQLFEEIGINAEYALSNVHEFTAALAEVTMLRNQIVVAKKGTIATFLAKLGKFFKKLFGDVAILSDESAGIGEQILGKEQWSAVKGAIRSIYDSQPDDMASDRIMRLFNVDVAEKIDKLRLVGLDETGRAGLTEAEEKTVQLKRLVDKAQEKLTKAQTTPGYTQADITRAQNAYDRSVDNLAKHMEKSHGPKTKTKLDEISMAVDLQIARRVDTDNAYTPQQIDAIRAFLLQLSEEDGKILRRTPNRSITSDWTNIDTDKVVDRIFKLALDEEKAIRTRGLQREAAMRSGETKVVSALDAEDRPIVETVAQTRISPEAQAAEVAEETEDFMNSLEVASLSNDPEVIKAVSNVKAAITLVEKFREYGFTQSRAGGPYDLSSMTDEQLKAIMNETGLTKTKILNHNEASSKGPLAKGVNDQAREKIRSFVDADLQAVNEQTKAIRDLARPKIQQAIDEDEIANSDIVQQAVSETSAGNKSDLVGEPMSPTSRAEPEAPVARPTYEVRVEEPEVKLFADTEEPTIEFEDLKGVSDDSLRLLLRSVDLNDLAIALKMTSTELKDRIINLLSDNDRSVVLSRIEESGPVRVNEVVEVQNRILELLKTETSVAPKERLEKIVSSDPNLIIRLIENEAKNGNIRDIAVVLLAMSPESGGAILRELPTLLVEKITRELVQLSDLPTQKIEEVVSNFLNRAELKTKTPKAKASDMGGKEPPAPPKAPAAAGDEGEPPKPPKTKKGPGEGEEPKKPSKAELAAEEYLNRRKISKIERGEFNKNHRLAKQGKTLSQLYADAVNGDTSILSPAYKAMLEDEGTSLMNPLERVARHYVDHAGGRFKTSFSNSTESLNERISILGDIGNFHRKTYTDADFDAEGGEGLADLFAEATSSSEGIMRYTDTTLASIRVQKGINELIGEKGVSMMELFDEVHRALKKNLMRNDQGKVTSLTQRDTDLINEWMQGMKEVYLRSRGFNPTKDKSFAQGSRIVQNIAYSMLGAKFAMSVLFVETPLAVLRTSGLNPFKMVHNTSQILGAYLRAAQGAAIQFKPLEKFMASLGMDTKIISESVDDMVYSMSNLRSTALSRFGAGGEALEESKLLFGLKERIKAHMENIRAAGESDMQDPSMTAKLMNYIEAFTGATADMTGTLSFMHPVTNAVREVASNQAKATLFKHSTALIELSKRIGKETEITTEGIVGIARELGIPKALAVYAAESGLLRRDGAIIDRIMKLGGFTSTSAGRELNLNELGAVIAAERSNLLETSMKGTLETAGKLQADIDANILPSLNQFIMYFNNELSPELRGTMRFQGMNPLTDLLFQMLSYPMAAYQALVGNGIGARGPLMTAGILTTLVGLEYFNRNAQRVLFGKDEEDRKRSLEKLTRIPTEEDIVEVLSMYATSSPMFGAIGSYMRDLVGNPIMRGYGTSERNFPATPFRSPAIGMLQKVYGQVSRAAGGLGTAYRTGDPGKMEAPLGNLLDTAYQISPLNSLPLGQVGTALKNVTSIDNLWKAAHVGLTEGSARNTQGFSYPPLEDASYMKWFNADESPRDLTEVQMPNLPMVQAETTSASPRESRQVMTPPNREGKGPSSGLADILE